jgi:HAE1 family hydrophobic/amphiphilic exporter-1
METAITDIASLVDARRQAGQIALGVEVRLAGTADELTQVRTALLGSWTGLNLQTLKSLLTSRMFLALLVIFLLMSALFESFLYPEVIMFSVLLAAVGGFVGLSMVHAADPRQQLDVLTMLGFVILIGIVVNNAILIVHQALNFMRGSGRSDSPATFAPCPREAIRHAVQTRVRPIFMTTATSVFGMLPLVLMPGSGSELYKGLGSVVVGGLILSTLFTLVVVPLLVSLVLDLRMKLFPGYIQQLATPDDSAD